MAQRGGDWRAQQERFERAEAAELQREQRARERQRSADEKDAARERKEVRAAEAITETAALDARVQELSEVLVHGVRTFGPLRPKHVVRPREVPPLALGRDDQPIPLPKWEEAAQPGLWSSMFGGRGRRERRREMEWARHEQARAEAETAEAARQARVGRKRRDYNEARQHAEAEAARQRQWAAELVAALTNREPAAVREMAELVLDRVPQPAGFPRHYKALASPDGSHVVVQWQLPASAVVPEQRAVQYLPTKDEKRPVARARKDCAALYRRLAAQLAVLVVRTVLVSDPGLERVTFSGHVEGVDPATGAEAYPCLLSLAVDREALPPDENLLRDGFDPEVCVTALGALISQHPYAQEPVEPFLDFDLTRFAFIDGLDAVSTLDSRPNLLEVSPSLFEHLVRQVLMQKGDEGWTTTESNDSGIDAVLVNRSTIMGGLSVVQAKRYKPSTKIGPAHIRELAGAMEEKKAGWGILVTTSSFTAGSAQKAKEHGRMQLIPGDELCWLIRERTGKDVLIG